MTTNLRSTDQFKACRQAALGMLARRDYFIQEIKRKLLRKGFLPKHVDIVLEDLADRRFVGNARVLPLFIEEAKRKHKGPLWIRKKLLEKGEYDITLDTIRQYYSVEEEKTQIQYLISRYGWGKDIAVRRLSARGFTELSEFW